MSNEISQIKNTFHVKTILSSTINEYISYAPSTKILSTTLINNNSKIILHNSVLSSSINYNKFNQYLVLNVNNGQFISYENKFLNNNSITTLNLIGGIILNDKNSKSVNIKTEKQLLNNQTIFNQNSFNSQNNLVNPHLAIMNEFTDKNNDPLISPILISNGQDYLFGNKSIKENNYPYEIIKRTSELSQINYTRIEKLNNLDTQTIYVTLDSNIIDLSGKINGTLIFLSNDEINNITIKNAKKTCKVILKNVNIKKLNIINCEYVKIINSYINSTINSEFTYLSYKYDYNFNQKYQFKSTDKLYDLFLNSAVYIQNSSVYFENIDTDNDQLTIKNVTVGIFANQLSNVYFITKKIIISETLSETYNNRPIIFLSLNGSNMWFGSTQFQTEVKSENSSYIKFLQQVQTKIQTTNQLIYLNSKYDINKLPYILKYSDNLSKINHSHDFSELQNNTYLKYKENTIPCGAIYQFAITKDNQLFISNVDILSADNNAILIDQYGLFKNYNELSLYYNQCQPHLSFYGDKFYETYYTDHKREDVINNVEQVNSISQQHIIRKDILNNFTE